MNRYTLRVLTRHLLPIVSALPLIACSDGSHGRGEVPPPAQAGSASGAAVEQAATDAAGTLDAIDSDVLLQRAVDRFTGDLDAMRDMRRVRALVSHSRTNFFLDGATKRGATYELIQQYEKALNEGVGNPADRIRMVYVPVPFDELLPALAGGYGDIAAAGLTITAERQKQVVFADPLAPNVRELVITHKSVTDVGALEGLAGRRVYVRPGSSYVDHLRTLSERLEQAGGKPIEIVEGDKKLGTEDILELVNAGVIPITVADNHIAELWAQVLPDIVVHDALAVHEGGAIAWAVRKDNPKLLADVNAFVAGHKRGTLLGNVIFKRYYADTKWIDNPADEAQRAKLDRMISLLQKYAQKYDFPWLAIAAQGYQESGLDQSKRSAAGAIGVMQLLPSTAADKNVGIPAIDKLENNIHAGVKYLGFLRDRYFDSPDIAPDAQVDFAWAAYNAGPARIAQLRERARERGLDPNRWFFNVERIAAEAIGRETVDYVANINKYYVAYRLLFDTAREKEIGLKAQAAGAG